MVILLKKLIILKFNKFSDLRGYLNSKSPNDVVKVTLLEKGKIKFSCYTLLKNLNYMLETIGVVKNA